MLEYKEAIAMEHMRCSMCNLQFSSTALFHINMEPCTIHYDGYHSSFNRAFNQRLARPIYEHSSMTTYIIYTLFLLHLYDRCGDGTCSWQHVEVEQEMLFSTYVIYAVMFLRPSRSLRPRFHVRKRVTRHPCGCLQGS